MAAFSVVYVLAAWVLSSLLTKKYGLLVFLVLMAAFVPAQHALRSGQRRRAYRILLGLLMATSVAGGLDTILRFAPDVIHGDLANVAYSGYHWLAGGIYDLDAIRGPVLRPGVRRDMYWNGLRWRHDVNAWGYRGPSLDRADAVFLGDSLIYGHGVEEAGTVPAQYARLAGQSAANLGQQGTCLIQDWYTFRANGTRLKPATVFVCVHYNDIADGLVFYDESALDRFVRAGTDPQVRPEYQPRPAWNLVWLWSRYVALPTRVGGLWSTAARKIVGRPAPAPAAVRDPFVPTGAEQNATVAGLDPADRGPERLSWLAQLRALREIKDECDRIGARLVVFDLGYPIGFTRAVETAARDLGAVYSPAGRVALSQAGAGVRVYLPDDGHWTPQGAAIVAEEARRATPSGR